MDTWTMRAACLVALLLLSAYAAELEPPDPGVAPLEPPADGPIVLAIDPSLDKLSDKFDPRKYQSEQERIGRLQDEALKREHKRRWKDYFPKKAEYVEQQLKVIDSNWVAGNELLREVYEHFLEKRDEIVSHVEREKGFAGLPRETKFFWETAKGQAIGDLERWDHSLDLAEKDLQEARNLTTVPEIAAFLSPLVAERLETLLSEVQKRRLHWERLNDTWLRFFDAYEFHLEKGDYRHHHPVVKCPTCGLELNVDEIMVRTDLAAVELVEDSLHRAEDVKPETIWMTLANRFQLPCNCSGRTWRAAVYDAPKEDL